MRVMRLGRCAPKSRFGMSLRGLPSSPAPWPGRLLLAPLQLRLGPAPSRILPVRRMAGYRNCVPREHTSQRSVSRIAIRRKILTGSSQSRLRGSRLGPALVATPCAPRCGSQQAMSRSSRGPDPVEEDRMERTPHDIRRYEPRLPLDTSCHCGKGTRTVKVTSTRFPVALHSWMYVACRETSIGIRLLCLGTAGCHSRDCTRRRFLARGSLDRPTHYLLTRVEVCGRRYPSTSRATSHQESKFWNQSQAKIASRRTFCGPPSPGREAATSGRCWTRASRAP